MRADTRWLHPALMPPTIGAGDLVKTRTSELLAVDALASGHGHAADVRTLRIAGAMVLALLGLGLQADGARETVAAAQGALRVASGCPPGAARLDGARLDSVRSMLLLLDALRAACGGPTYARALLAVQRQWQR